MATQYSMYQALVFSLLLGYTTVILIRPVLFWPHKISLSGGKGSA
jgi:hypothetical protein